MSKVIQSRISILRLRSRCFLGERGMFQRVFLTIYTSYSAYQQNLNPGVAALVQVTNFTNSQHLLPPPLNSANQHDAATTSTITPDTNTSTLLPSISPKPSSSHHTSHHTSAGAIAGSVIGALAFLASLATGSIYFLKRRKAAKAATNKQQISIEVAPYAQIRTGRANELPDQCRPAELKDQALVEMGHDQRRGAWEAVEIGQRATPVWVHEL